jgi:choline monooxygenase
MPTNYKFDPNLATAITPPAYWYTDADFLALEQEKVFGRAWQLVGRAEQSSQPGQFFTADIAGESIVVARGDNGKLRAFSNVCRHRAGPVAAGAGRCKRFRCAYHGWTYTLDGALLGTPEFDGVANFDHSANCLPQFQAKTWGSLVFANLDAQAGPLTETLEDLPERLAGRGMSKMTLAARKDWELNANWKVYVDNYLEGYHIPVAHPGLNKEIDYGKYHTETKRFYSIQHSPILAETADNLRLSEGAEEAALFIWVFPNLMINVYPDNYSTNLIIPLGPERTLTIFEWYFRDPETPETQEKIKQTIAFSDEIQIEDIKICEDVQKGLRSRHYHQGRYSVKRENGPHHFHGLLSYYLQK